MMHCFLRIYSHARIVFHSRVQVLLCLIILFCIMEQKGYELSGGKVHICVCVCVCVCVRGGSVFLEINYPVQSVYCCCCLVTQMSLILCEPVDCSLPGSSVHGILLARILE